MIIYEVNLDIKSEIYDEFLNWLKTHIEEVLQFNGFKKAKIFSEEINSDNTIRKLTICYDLDSRISLQEYFDNHATKMRKLTLDKFGDNVKAFRRIFELKNVIEK